MHMEIVNTVPYRYLQIRKRVVLITYCRENRKAFGCGWLSAIAHQTVLLNSSLTNHICYTRFIGLICIDQVTTHQYYNKFCRQRCCQQFLDHEDKWHLVSLNSILNVGSLPYQFCKTFADILQMTKTLWGVFTKT